MPVSEDAQLRKQDGETHMRVEKQMIRTKSKAMNTASTLTLLSLLALMLLIADRVETAPSPNSILAASFSAAPAVGAQAEAGRADIRPAAVQHARAETRLAPVAPGAAAVEAFALRVRGVTSGQKIRNSSEPSS